MKTARHVPHLVCLLAGGLLLAPVAASAAPSVKVHLQFPVNATNPAATNLNTIETYGKDPLLSKTFTVPYDAVQKTIAAELKTRLANVYKSGTKVKLEAFTGCPDDDITLWANYQTSFKFTQKNDPTVAKVGSSSQNKVKASVKTRAKVRVWGKLHAKADTPTPLPVGFVCGEEHVEVPFDLWLEVELAAAGQVTLWPTIAADDVAIAGKVIGAAPSLDIDGQLVKIGASYGVVLGGSPVGLAMGGPIAFSTIGALAGNELEDAIVKESHAMVDKLVDKGFDKALAGASQAIQDALSPAAATANAAKDKALSTKLPGVGKSVTQLQAEMGGSIALHTVTPNGSLATSAVLRMSPTQGASKLTAEIQIPAGKCIYVENAGGSMPVGFAPINKTLDAKVGQPCATALAGIELAPFAYLGANPRVALGSSAETLPTWKANMGKAALQGTLAKVGNHFTCKAEVSKMPNLAIMDLRLSKGTTSLDVVERHARVLVRSTAGTTVAFEGKFEPVTTPIAGGEYTCESATAPTWTLNQLAALKKLLDDCTECGSVLERGDHLVYHFNDVAKVRSHPVAKDVAAAIEAKGSPASARAKGGQR